MKKIVTISLVLLFLLYQVGFIAVYWVSLFKIEDHWQAKFEYDQPFKKVTIPISVPYWTDQDDYRPVDGKLELGGIHYRKVFQKYEKDTIHVLVVRDTMSEKLEEVTRNLITSQNSSPHKSNKSAKNFIFLKNDLQLADDFQWKLNEIDIFSTYNSEYKFFFSTRFISVETPPPKIKA